VVPDSSPRLSGPAAYLKSDYQSSQGTEAEPMSGLIVAEAAGVLGLHLETCCIDCAW
jgi:hypothetical protein